MTEPEFPRPYGEGKGSRDGYPECWACAGPATEGWADHQAPSERPLCRDCFEITARQFAPYLIMFVGQQILLGTPFGRRLARALGKARRD